MRLALPGCLALFLVGNAALGETTSYICQVRHSTLDKFELEIHRDKDWTQYWKNDFTDSHSSCSSFDDFDAVIRVGGVEKKVHVEGLLDNGKGALNASIYLNTSCSLPTGDLTVTLMELFEENGAFGWGVYKKDFISFSCDKKPMPISKEKPKRTKRISAGKLSNQSMSTPNL